MDKTGHNNIFDPALFPYYGRVDNNGNFIYPSETHLTPLMKNKETSADTVYVLNFVADAFLDLQDHFNLANELGILDKRPRSISTINPVKGWESVHDAYAKQIEIIYQVLISSYFEKPNEHNGLQYSKPENFDSYMKSVKHMFSSKGKHLPLTRTAFLMSKHTGILNSGLAIEIEPAIDYGDDPAKNFIFVQSPNYNFYIEALKKFGFMADKEYPGRIIADLGSPKMQAYMRSYNLTLENVFDNYFYKSKDYDYEIMRVYLIQIYNNYCGLYPIKSVSQSHRSMSATKYRLRLDQLFLQRGHFIDTADLKRKCLSTTILKKRQPLLDNDLVEKYNDDYWLPVYAEFLNYELGNPLNEHELEKTIKNAKDLKKNVDFDTAIGYIGDKFNFYRYPATNLSLINYKYIKLSNDSTPADDGSSNSSGGY